MSEDRWIIRMIVATLCFTILIVVAAFVAGLFTPSVDNASIFKVIGPTFQSVSGGLLVLLTQMLGNRASKPAAN